MSDLVDGVAHGTGSCIGLCIIGPIVVVIAIVATIFSPVWIPIFSEGYSNASARDKIVEAPRVLASMESAYLAALAENEDNVDITEKLLNFTPPDKSKFFKYEFVRYAQGSIAGYKATASKNIGKFNEGNFLQTVYQKDSDNFTRCVGGNGADVSVVQELVPNFNVTVECSDVEIKKVSGSASVPTQQKSTGIAPTGSRDSRLVNAEGEAWRHLTVTNGIHTIIFRSNGSFNWAREFRGEEGDWESLPTQKGKWHTDGNKIIMISDGGDKDTMSYNITSRTKMTLNLWGERDIEFDRDKIEQ
jgi:hypothetical protein